MNEKRHIVLVGHSPNLHGAEYSLLRLIQRLKDRAQLKVLAPGGGDFEREVKRLRVPFLAFEPVYPFALLTEKRCALAPFLKRLRENVEYLKGQIQEVDLIHSNTLYVWEGAGLAAHWGCPHLWNVREVPGASPTWRPALGWPLTLEWLKDLSDGLVAVSGAAKDGLGESLGEMTRVVHNGLDVEPESQELSRKWMEESWGLKASDKIILTVGNLIPEKGHGQWLKAIATRLKANPNWHLIWVGHSGLCGETLRLEVDSLGLGNQVHMVGAVSGVGKKMAGADVYVLPSLTEAFPTVLLEARACGVPFLANACGGTLEISREGGGLECQGHGELASLTEAVLKKTCEIPDARMGSFTMKIMADAYWDFYRELKERDPRLKKKRWDALLGLEADLSPAHEMQTRIDSLKSKRGIGRVFRKLFPR
jgi:glycosyltransferase involved in cell wall biosynthesis